MRFHLSGNALSFTDLTYVKGREQTRPIVLITSPADARCAQQTKSTAKRPQVNALPFALPPAATNAHRISRSIVRTYLSLSQVRYGRQGREPPAGAGAGARLPPGRQGASEGAGEPAVRQGHARVRAAQGAIFGGPCGCFRCAVFLVRSAEPPCLVRVSSATGVSHASLSDTFSRQRLLARHLSVSCIHIYIRISAEIPGRGSALLRPGSPEPLLPQRAAYRSLREAVPASGRPQAARHGEGGRRTGGCAGEARGAGGDGAPAAGREPRGA